MVMSHKVVHLGIQNILHLVVNSLMLLFNNRNQADNSVPETFQTIQSIDYQTPHQAFQPFVIHGLDPILDLLGDRLTHFQIQRRVVNVLGPLLLVLHLKLLLDHSLHDPLDLLHVEQRRLVRFLRFLLLVDAQIKLLGDLLEPVLALAKGGRQRFAKQPTSARLAGTSRELPVWDRERNGVENDG